MAIGEILLLVFVFVIAGFLGVELISKVPSQLHTPLMSGTNAISGIIVVGSILQMFGTNVLIDVLSFIAITIASINIFGGFTVKQRMLKMFKKG